jgi:hypothetical protein
MSSSRPIKGIPEDRVTRVLARAAELDRGPAVLSLDTIRAAAIEAGISSSAVDQALEEYAAAQTRDLAPVAMPEQPRPRGRLRRWLRKLAEPLQFAAVAFALGLAASVDEVMVPLVFVAWIAIAVRLLFRMRRTGRTGTFQLTTVLMTLAICFANVSVEGDEDVLSVFLVTGIALFVAGATLAHWGDQEDSLGDGRASAT